MNNKEKIKQIEKEQDESGVEVGQSSLRENRIYGKDWRRFKDLEDEE